MKAKELAGLLLQNPDFDVKVCVVSKTTIDSPWPHYDFFDVDDIADVGYSSKEIVLGLS